MKNKYQKPEFGFKVTIFRHLETMRKTRMEANFNQSVMGIRAYSVALFTMKDFLTAYFKEDFEKKWKKIEEEIRKIKGIPSNTPKRYRKQYILENERKKLVWLNRAFSLLMQLLADNKLLLEETYQSGMDEDVEEFEVI